MGAELAKEVAVRGGHLSGNAFKVLTRMAWTALDRPNEKGQPARLYFGGWEPLALALGWELPAQDDPGRARRRKRLQTYVGSALKELYAEYAFEKLEDKPRSGVRQTYQLTPERLRVRAPQELRGGRTPEPKGQSTPKTEGHVPLTNWGQSTPEPEAPRKQQDSGEDLPQDTTTRPSAQPSGSAQACGGCGHNRFATDGECLRCGETRAA